MKRTLGTRPDGLHDSIFIHPASLVESTTIGQGTRIWGFAHIMEGAKIGRDCNIGGHAFVERGAVLGNGVKVKNGVSVWDGVVVEDDAFLGPHMIFTNVLKPRAFLKTPREGFLPTRIGRGATIGAGAVIICGNEVGEYAFIAAGAVVTRSVPPYGLVAGNPGRLKGFVCRCLETTFLSKDVPVSCQKCGTSRPEPSAPDPLAACSRQDFEIWRS